MTELWCMEAINLVGPVPPFCVCDHIWIVRIVTVLIINKPFKGAPFLAGFPGTISLFFLYQLVREKPAI